MTEKIHSFPPVLPERPRVLILGSMPGGVSLEKQQYYGNPRNHFWKIIYVLFHSEEIEDYEERLEFLKQKGIALWDSIGACYREGSLDASIQAEEPNDIAGLLRQHPTIRLIACNGTKSYQTFRKNFPAAVLGDTEVLQMPSTSPIPGKYTKTFDGKVEEWKRIMAYLD